MPLSMTGFGAAEASVAGRALRVEIRTVNHRFFNPAFKLPGDLAAFEGDLRDRLRKEFDRGHVAVSLRWEDADRRAGPLRLNLDRAREAMARLRELQVAAGLSGEIPLELLARQVDVLTADQAEPAAVTWAEVEPVVGAAARECVAMRRREGVVLAAELLERLASLERLAVSVSELAPARVVRERDRLREAVRQLLEGQEADDPRLQQEIALLADRLDVTEELVRLRAHVAAGRDGLGRQGAIGKELGFLAQELGREVNTIGSKANDTAIAQLVIVMKGELEKFREQAENLE